MNGKPFVYFDGPAGSQVPESVAAAVASYLTTMNANHGGVFATSIESDAMLDAAHAAVADFLGADDPDCVAFGANMTTLTFALSRALAKTWKPGDEVIVTRLDHDANVTPWVLAARDAGAVVKHISINPEDCTLNLDELKAAISPRTKLVAVGYASNAVGTVNPIAEIAKAAHAVGALVFVDAVHFAPHRLIDVRALECDFLACSAYKFFGPHIGILWGHRELLDSLAAYKLRPASDELPGKWMTGTQSHEGIAGVAAAIQYLERLAGKGHASRRSALESAFAKIRAHEESLALRILEGLQRIRDVRVFGIVDPARIAERVPTFMFTHARLLARDVAGRLAEQGIFTWHGNYYALPLTDALGLEPHGGVRVGLLHYNTSAEVDRLLAALETL